MLLNISFLVSIWEKFYIYDAKYFRKWYSTVLSDNAINEWTYTARYTFYGYQRKFMMFCLPKIEFIALRLYSIIAIFLFSCCFCFFTSLKNKMIGLDNEMSQMLLFKISKLLLRNAFINFLLVVEECNT